MTKDSEARDPVLPPWSNLTGLVLPCEDSGVATAFRLVTLENGEFRASSSESRIAVLFGALRPGAVAVFSANAHRDVVGLRKVDFPGEAQVVGLSRSRKAFIARDRNGGQWFDIRPADIVMPSADGGLVLGARFSYHRGPDGQPGYGVVKSVPRPVAVWRRLVNRVALPAFMARERPRTP